MKKWSILLLLLIALPALAQKNNNAERYLKTPAPQEWAAMTEGNSAIDDELFQQTLQTGRAACRERVLSLVVFPVCAGA